MPDNVLLTSQSPSIVGTEAPTGAWINETNEGLGAYIDITPNNLGSQQFVVDKSNFSIGNGDGTNYPATEVVGGDEVWVNGEGSVILPPEVDRVRITNVGQGGQPGNTVRVFVTLYDDWVFSPGWNGNIDIDIDGGATAYSPIFNEYMWSIMLTNGIWPGGNDQTVWSNNDIINNNGTPIINSTGDFYLANYNQQTADAWNNHEVLRRQNPNAIPNCIIQQINSPIQTPIADILDDDGVGHTWVSNSVELPCNIQFRIKPASPAWKISSEDFAIMTGESQRMMINEPPYEEGFAYFAEGEANMSTQIETGSQDLQNTAYWSNPYYQLQVGQGFGFDSIENTETAIAGSWPWQPTFSNNNTNTVDNCWGSGEPSSQPVPNWIGALNGELVNLFPFDGVVNDDYISMSFDEYILYPDEVSPLTTASYFNFLGGEDWQTIGQTGNYGINWPGFTGFLTQDDVNSFFGDISPNGNNEFLVESGCGETWDTTTGLVNSGSGVKYFSKPVMFKFNGNAGDVYDTIFGGWDPTSGQLPNTVITRGEAESINYQYNINNLDLNNYRNPYSPLNPMCHVLELQGDDSVDCNTTALVDWQQFTGVELDGAVWPPFGIFHTAGNAIIGAYSPIIQNYSLLTRYPNCWNLGTNTFFARTIFMEDTNPGENDNNIIVTILPCPNCNPFSSNLVGVTEASKHYIFQINGHATPAAQGAPPPINAGFNLISDSNSGNITVTRTSNSNMSENVENLLQPTQRNTYSFSARIPNNELTNLATIKVEAEEGYYLAEIPYLSIDNTSPNLNFDIGQNIQLKLSESTSNTSYTFDLLYKNNESISALDDLNININFRSLVTQTRALEIRNITFGNQTVSAGGESRNITIYGKPGTPFELLVNSVDENLDSDDRVVDSTEESIISNRVSNSEVVIGTGKTFNQLSEKIHSTGKYSFNQTIPNTTIRSTAINGSMASGGATKIIFDDLTYVRVGDQVVMKEITSGFITVTELNPDGDNENECTVSASITAADNALVSFKRSKKYRIHVKPGTDASVNTTGAMASWNTDIDGWSGYYSKDMNQYLNPVLTLRATTSEGAGVMTMNGATWNSSTPYDLTYVGRPNTLQSKIQGKTGVPTTNFTLTYLLDLVNPARNFAYVDTIDPAPAFSSNVEFINTTETPQVDWTNTTPELNGGTIIHMSNIAITAAGANTITITANVELVKWGSSNVIMELNLDNIVSNS